jgi:hypothetical protein
LQPFIAAVQGVRLDGAFIGVAWHGCPLKLLFNWHLASAAPAPRLVTTSFPLTAAVGKQMLAAIATARAGSSLPAGYALTLCAFALLPALLTAHSGYFVKALRHPSYVTVTPVVITGTHTPL